MKIKDLRDKIERLQKCSETLNMACERIRDMPNFEALELKRRLKEDLGMATADFLEIKEVVTGEARRLQDILDNYELDIEI